MSQQWVRVSVHWGWLNVRSDLASARSLSFISELTRSAQSTSTAAIRVPNEAYSNLGHHVRYEAPRRVWKAVIG